MSDCHQIGCHRASVEIVRDEPCCERHAILRRAGWRCEAIIPDRLHPGEYRQCSIVGSEIEAHGAEARCPRHWDL